MRALVVAAAALIAVGCQGAPVAAPQQRVHNLAPDNLPRFFDCLRERGQTVVAAHRGGPAPGYTENAIPTFENTLRHTPALLEIDIAQTSDGVLVLMHDDTVDRTTTGTGPANELNLAEFQALRLEDETGVVLDAHPPTLRETLDWATGRTILELDVKGSVSFDNVIAEVRAAGAQGRVIFITYGVDAAIRVHRLAPELMISVNIASAGELDELARAGVDLTRILAWTGTEEPNSALNVALAARGVEAMFGTLGNPERSWDGRFARAGADQYAAFADTGLALIATDRPIEAARDLDAGDGVEGTGALQFAAVETPSPGPREIRVRHEAIGVNFIDTYHRTGLYKIPLPSGLGVEAAGFVDVVGEGVTRFKAGERVAYGSGPLGAYAEMHVVNEIRAVRLPDAIAFDIAAASLLKGMTARYLLRKTFRVEPGHVALIHAAAGGVGQILVQWAKHLGAHVIATVGSEAKVEIARALGADHVIVSSRENIAARVREITNGTGAHVVYDGVGKDTWEASLDCLAPLSMMVSFGNASGPPPDINPLALSQKGSLFLTRPTLAHYTAATGQLDETAADLFEALARGAVKIAPPTRYTLADAAQAHRDLEARTTTGSLVLVP